MCTILQFFVFTTIILLTFEIEPQDGKETNQYLVELLASPKISGDLKAILPSLESGEPGQIHVIVEFVGGTLDALTRFRNSDLARSTSASRNAKITNLVELLERNAATSQAEVLVFLNRIHADYTQFWVSNEIVVKNVKNLWIIKEVCKFANVSFIRPEFSFKPLIPFTKEELTTDLRATEQSSSFNQDITHHIQQVQGRCTDIKCLGEGVVVAVIDTGVLWTHEELKENYRYEYGWFDPFKRSKFPWFTGPHGTHVAGILAGKTKGIAPRAQWIACLAGDDEEWFEAPVKACGQWALCPSKWNDPASRDCSKAPHIINNSWYFGPTAQRDTIRNFYYEIQAAWNAAGIHTAFCAGNSGPYCASVHPPASYDIAFSVAAVDKTSTAAWWSSRGPVLNMEFDSRIDLSSEKACMRDKQFIGSRSDICINIKPDISAPGVNINSSSISSNRSYSLMYGTSMATAVVSGVMALMLCANNQAHGKVQLDVGTVRHILTSTASTERINLTDGNYFDKANNYAKLSHLLCNRAYGNIYGYPNNIYGWGEIDACAAVKKVKTG